MSEGVSKKSRYEIIAILREEFRVKSKLDFSFNDLNWQSDLRKVDSSSFYIDLPPSFQPSLSENGDVCFQIHSKLGRIEFATAQINTEHNSPDNIFRFAIPESINILQRRSSPRLKTRESYQFCCSGRYKNGVTFKHTLNDVSDGGCSFISTQSQLKFMRKDNVLENVEMSFGEYGSVMTNLKIISVTELHSEKSYEEADFRISCMFQHKSDDYKHYIENVIVKLIIDNKIKNKIFLV